MLMTFIHEVLGSNLGRDAVYPYCGFRGFPHSFRASVGTVFQVRPRPLPYTPFPIHYAMIIGAMLVGLF
jgi:hypothetical protein